jgi:hypothetical protein
MKCAILENIVSGRSNPYLCSSPIVNLLKPTGYGMYHQFNIQQLYVLPTL